MTHRQLVLKRSFDFAQDKVPNPARKGKIIPCSRHILFPSGKSFLFIDGIKTMGSVIIHRIAKDGGREEKEIYELAEEDKNKCCLLGQATGINMDHCVILGSKYKDDFWHRVYGYRIVENEKMEKMMLEAEKKMRPEVTSYITVAFYERLADRRVMFVPSRLEIPDRPELNNFPFNIAFGTVTLADDNTERQETSVYEPDFTTFTQEGVEQKMKYYNNLNLERHFWAEIVYNTNDQSYVGTKYCGDKYAGMAFGKNWDMFSVHFTALGVTNDVGV